MVYSDPELRMMKKRDLILIIKRLQHESQLPPIKMDGLCGNMQRKS